jgi:hypothetical protein
VTVLKETIKLNNGRTQTLRTARTPKPVLVPAPPPVPVPGLVRNGRRAAIGLAGAIAVASFVLSFAGLASLALRSGIPERLAWLWPMMLGGAVAQATVAIMALAAYPAQARNRRFFYGVMIASVGVLIGGNVLGALTVGPMPLVLGALIATVVPLSLLATTHGLAVLTRFNPEKEI